MKKVLQSSCTLKYLGMGNQGHSGFELGTYILKSAQKIKVSAFTFFYLIFGRGATVIMHHYTYTMNFWILY